MVSGGLRPDTSQDDNEVSGSFKMSGFLRCWWCVVDLTSCCILPFPVLVQPDAQAEGGGCAC